VVDGKECQAAYFSLQQAKTRSSSFFLVWKKAAKLSEECPQSHSLASSSYL
jgi:hypothetical protein